jgi:lipoprotein-anchoring transpeptidase ErfK/SrfK
MGTPQDGTESLRAPLVGRITGLRWRIPALVLGVLLAVLVAGAWVLDQSRSDVVASGVHAGPIPLGGLSAKAARTRLARTTAANAHRRLVLRAGPEHLTVIPAKAGITLDVNRMADAGLRASRGGSFISRDFRVLTGGKVNAAVAPQLAPSSGRAVRRLVRRIDRQPQNASVGASPAGLHITPSAVGLSIRAAAVRSAVAGALLNGAHTATLPVHRTQPAIALATLRRRYPSYITIDRGGFDLRLYQHLHLVRTYPIAVGMQGLATPAGLYHIQDKQVDPAWQVPNSAWAGSLAGQTIPPGPQDPLKARWMGFFDGSGIHGTDETWSIGHNASHGCVRMLIPDVIDLYSRVRVGTPVYIGD